MVAEISTNGTEADEAISANLGSSAPEALTTQLAPAKACVNALWSARSSKTSARAGSRPTAATSHPSDRSRSTMRPPTAP
ncbi:hypothetical protein BJF84_26385 [Rhodococcus sp. CUA-806]|nr:hypothetical protein BJF84_26385 [Rhodococcus sp. CUA-806]